MSDSELLINGQVIPYSGGRMDRDTNSWRDATELELEQQKRIRTLEVALSNLIDVASQCDGWESFPSAAITVAEDVL